MLGDVFGLVFSTFQSRRLSVDLLKFFLNIVYYWIKKRKLHFLEIFSNLIYWYLNISKNYSIYLFNNNHNLENFLF